MNDFNNAKVSFFIVCFLALVAATEAFDLVDRAKSILPVQLTTLLFTDDRFFRSYVARGARAVVLET